MFRSVEKTWNVEIGCTHGCGYCWARRQAKRQKHRCLDCYHFRPHFHPERLNRVPSARRIFVCDMGDLFCEAVPDEWIATVIRTVERYPDREFLFCTKNPTRYHDFDFPPNAILGATIETNRDGLASRYSRAPKPSERYRAMHALPRRYRRFLSVEPILDFDLPILLGWIRDIRPAVCEIGYDNYGFRLLEPSLAKTRQLIRAKQSLGLDTREKDIRLAWWE